MERLLIKAATGGRSTFMRVLLDAYAFVLGEVEGPEQVEQLLAGRLTSGVQMHVVEKETRVLLGQPAQYPIELVKSLSALFAKLPAVRAATWR